MANIKAFRPVVHEKKIFKGFCYINLYKTMSFRAYPFLTPGSYLNELETPCQKDVPCQISRHSGQSFIRRRFLKVFAI